MEFTSRPGPPSSSRYIEVYRDGGYISRHSIETEATESAFAHATAHGLDDDAEYEFRYPNKVLVIRKSDFIQQVGGGVTPLPDAQITNVNAGNPVYNNQSVVVIVGDNFGDNQGTGAVSYFNVPLLVLNWTNTRIDVVWVDAPFDPVWRNAPLPMSYLLQVTTNSGKSAGATVTTIANPVAWYGIINSVDEPGSIYIDDVGIELSADKSYVRMSIGTMDFFDSSTGVPSGLSDPAEIQYVLWDESEQSWSDPAYEYYTSSGGA